MDVDVFKAIKGKSEDAPELKNYVESIGEIPLIEDFDGGRRYYNFHKTGMDLVFDDSVLVEIQLFTNKVKDNSCCYQQPLPRNLNFTDSSEMVFKKLGSPNVLKEGMQNHKLLGIVYPWCKYLFDDYSLRIEYDMDKSKIRMVSLSSQA